MISISMPLTQPILIDNLLTSEQCASIINNLPAASNTLAIDSTRLQPDKWTDANWSKKHSQNNTNRIKLTTESSKHIIEYLTPSIPEINDAKDKYVYVCFYDEDDFCKPHIDPSKYTLIVGLNNDYTGGKLHVGETAVNLKAGSGIMFPGNMLHSVETIDVGRRWSLTLCLF